MDGSKFLLLICLELSLIVSIWACHSSFFTGKKKPPEPTAPWLKFNVSSFEKIIEEKCECGVRPRKSFRISGGENADRNEFPFQAAIVYRNTRIPFCGGTLINNQYILTAAHCLLNLPKILTLTNDFLNENDFQVLLNAHKLNTLNEKTAVKLYKSIVLKSWDLEAEVAEADFEEGTLRFDVRRKVFHSEFVTEYRKYGFDYDVALLELKTPVNLTLRNSPIPICLPRTGELENYEDNEENEEEVMTLGWGRQNFKEFTSGSPILQKIQFPVYSLKECSEITGIQVSRRFICAGHQTKRKDIGKSDSGGPLLLTRAGQTTQIGITSWGAGEVDGHVASAFTRVSEFLPWIYYTMKSGHEGGKEIIWCSEERQIYEPSSSHSDQMESQTDLNDVEDATTTDMTTTMISETEEPQ